ncbi:5' exonuclease Apollo [Liparis tanakae]|uniref:5' exonuclease Apollo n=1 Tax=Liparis tanakae TaxID=230148 RepID=A0A4Z2IY20_9TELE|nr:5' exonuclease Apollo [Liparis tanakae]
MTTSHGRPGEPQTMPVNGKVIPNTPLAVDFWHVRKCPDTRMFFLSHMHSDHTVKEQWIHPLDLDEPYLLPLDDINEEKLMVTLINANHCPGAVMFLFQGYFGSILYTGDFRYSPSMLREPCLRTNANIDVLYLDNTNCDPNRTLPSRERATQQIKEIIGRHDNHKVVIGLYALGKESLLLKLAMEFKTWIEVSYERMQTLKVLELPDVFTIEPGAGRIRAVEQSAINSANLNKWNKEQPTLAIIPTSRPLVSFHPDIHVVPYSDHSSYQELEDFVSALQPSSLIPIVGNHLPICFSALLPSKKRHEFLVPESVRHYMLRRPESQLCSPSYPSHRRRFLRPLDPKGVVFDSPEKGSEKSCKESSEAECREQDASGVERDAESSGRDSDCVLVDPSRDPTPNKKRRGIGDLWSLNIVQTVSEDMLMAEFLPFSQLSQSNFAPMEILTNTQARLKSVRKTRGPFESNAKIINIPVSNEKPSSERSRLFTLQNNYALSGSGGTSQRSGHGVDQDCDIVANDQLNNIVTTLRSSLNDSCSSSGSETEVKQEYLEELERPILKALSFTEEDMKERGLLQQSFVQLFPLSPVCEAQEDDLSDE